MLLVGAPSKFKVLINEKAATKLRCRIKVGPSAADAETRLDLG